MNKSDELLARLKAGWCPASVLCVHFQWQPHSLRGAISTIAKKQGVKIERRKEDGITSYRVAPAGIEAAAE